MAFTSDQLIAQEDALKKAIRSGVLMVQHGDKTVRYRDVAELEIALTGVQSDMTKLAGRRTRRIRYTSISKALG